MFKIEGPNFFKYITSSACTDRLVIPLGHCWNKKGVVFPDSVILKDNNGNTWPVKVRKVENRVCFVGAEWLKFVRDNRIQPESFLIVLLSDDDDDDDDGPNVFSFVLLDAVTRCETGGFLGPPSHVLSSVLEPSSSSLFPQEDDLISDHQSIQESDDDDDDDVTVNDDDDDEKEHDTTDHTDDEEHPTKPSQGNTSSAKAKGKRRARKTGPQQTDPYGEEIFRSRAIPRPKNPYFVFYMNKQRPNELRLPFKVVKDYQLYLPKIAKIRDPQGKEWETTLSQWRDGRVVYQGVFGRNGGMGSFFRVNHVQVGEPCVCEFKYADEVEKDLTLYVYKVSDLI